MRLAFGVIMLCSLMVALAQQQASDDKLFHKRKLLDEPNPDWAEPTER